MESNFHIVLTWISDELSLLLQAPGPLAEIVFWQERSATLRALSEQLKQPAVTKVIEVVTKKDSGIVQTLEGAVTELNKSRTESDDNLRFLSTLERHFMVKLFLMDMHLNLLFVLSIFNKYDQRYTKNIYFKWCFPEFGNWGEFWSDSGNYSSPNGQPANCMDAVVLLQHQWAHGSFNGAYRLAALWTCSSSNWCQ